MPLPMESAAGNVSASGGEGNQDTSVPRRRRHAQWQRGASRREDDALGGNNQSQEQPWKPADGLVAPSIPARLQRIIDRTPRIIRAEQELRIALVVLVVRDTDVVSVDVLATELARRHELSAKSLVDRWDLSVFRLSAWCTCPEHLPPIIDLTIAEPLVMVVEDRRGCCSTRCKSQSHQQLIYRRR